MTIEELYPKNTICEGDNLDYLRSFPDNSFDMIYGDPPYNSNRNYSAPAGTEAEGTAFKDFWSWSDISEEIFFELGVKYPELAQFLSSIDKGHSKGMKAYCVMMAIRLIEMERVLKDTGTIYIHCDHAAVSYLKILMDFIFGKKNFRNQIGWKRTRSNKPSKKNLPNNYDFILRYSKMDKYLWNLDHMYLEPDKNFVKRFNKNDNDGRGPYWLDNFRLPKSYENSKQAEYKTYELLGIYGIWSWSKERALEGIKDGIIIRTKKRVCKKIYLSESKGTQLDNIWVDIPNIMSKDPEFTGYPTQKPRKLLRRLIQLSSNEGDLILDPFCGSGTTCIEAQSLNRRYIGIDVSYKTVTFIRDRLEKELGLFNNIETKPDVVTVPRQKVEVVLPKIEREIIPQETSLEESETHKNYRKWKPKLYLDQEGRCNGCNIFCIPQHLSVDHIDGVHGNNAEDNLQLLCNNCNSIKGQNNMSFLKKRIKERQKDPESLYV